MTKRQCLAAAQIQHLAQQMGRKRSNRDGECRSLRVSPISSRDHLNPRLVPAELTRQQICSPYGRKTRMAILLS
jgi:hypothetical protein